MIDFKAYQSKLLDLRVELNDPVSSDYWGRNETNCPVFLRGMYELFNGTKGSDVDPRNHFNIASLTYSKDLLESFAKRGWLNSDPLQYFILGDILIDSFFVGIPQANDESVVWIGKSEGPEIIYENFREFFERLYNGNY